MSFESLHTVRLPIRAAAAIFALGTLTGCQAFVSSAPVAQVRVIAASPDAPALDVYRGSNALAYNLGFGTVTSYIPLTSGTDTFTANTAGSRQVLSTAKAALLPSGQYTVLIGNSIAGMQQLTLTDQSQPAPSGQIALRFINQATRVPAADIYLVPAGQRTAAVTPLLTNLVFGANTGYLNIPAGTYSLVVAPAGVNLLGPTIGAYTGPQITYSAGSARSMILIDQQLTSGLQVITADDFEPSSPTG